VLERTAEALRVRVPASLKPSNILKLLESAGCADALARGLIVTRERCWAKADTDVGAKAGQEAGLHPATDGGAAGASGPVSYFELDLPS